MKIPAEFLAKWPAANLEWRPTAKLIPYARNARLHSPEQVKAIAASIAEFGWTIPVLVDEAGEIIAGHGRILAASPLGIKVVPVLVARGWTDAQKRAYRLADNQLTIAAAWNVGTLKAEIEGLKTEGFNLSLTGFDDAALLDLFPPQGHTDPDDAPEPQAEAVSRAGDLWLLGNHRLLCGDCTKAEDVARAMGDALADLCFTSPPYAQQRDYQKAITDWDSLMNGAFGCLRMTTAGQVLVNLGLVHRDGEWQPYWEGWIAWMRKQGWRRFGWYVWDQGPGLPGDWNGRLAPSHEWIFHFNKEAERARKTVDSKHAGEILSGKGLRSKDGSLQKKTGHGNQIQPRRIADSVIRQMRQKGSIGVAGKHVAPFSAGFARELIEAFSDAGDAVYDPFVGSGTTIIAAEMTGRHCIALEVAPQYIDVAVRRWMAFSGREAVHEESGKTFSEIAFQRNAEIGKIVPSTHDGADADEGVHVLREDQAI